MQHLPFILLADAVVKWDDRAVPKMASNKMMASGFMLNLFFSR